MRRHRAQRAISSLLCAALHAVLAYHDPALKTHGARRCETSASNHESYPDRTVLPPPEANAFNVSGWVRQYLSALKAQPTDFATLRALKVASSLRSTKATFSLPGHFDQSWFDFIQVKLKMLDALEDRAKLFDLWRQGRSLVDVGGGHGMLAAYLMARHDMNVTVFDVPNSYQCEEIMSSPLKVHFFDGKTLPVPDDAVDAVSFMSVLHHAASSTETLLHQAARVARHWIVVLEDTQTPLVARRNKAHDPHGIFRSDAEWKRLFERVPGFRLVRDGYVGAPRQSNGFAVGVHGDEERCFSKWYVLESHGHSKWWSGAGRPQRTRQSARAEILPPTRQAKYVNRTCVPQA